MLDKNEFNELLGMMNLYSNPAKIRDNAMFKFKLELFNELTSALPSVPRGAISAKVILAKFNFSDAPSTTQFEELLVAITNMIVNLVITVASNYNIAIADAFASADFPSFEI